MESIQKYVGVYSHFQFFSRPVLESGSGAFNYSSTFSCTQTTKETVGFSFSVAYELEESLSAEINVDGISASASASERTGASFSYDYTWSRLTQVTTNESTYLSLTQSSATYCPSGYSMSLGYVGTYYVLTIEFQDYTNWWWGDYPTQGTSLQATHCLISNEPQYSVNYVFSKVSDPDTLYYMI